MRSLLKIGVLGVVLVGFAAACNHQDACPTTDKVGDGLACSSEGLQCGYDVTFIDCDGTKQTIASSCMCTEGVWSCPSNPDCEQDSGAPPDDSGAPQDDASSE